MKATESGPDDPIRICIAGALGRMGSTVAREASPPFVIGGAIESTQSSMLGMTLGRAGVVESDVVVSPPSKLAEVLGRCDVFVSFSTAEAELSNLPIVASLRKPAVVGTTGFSSDQRALLETVVKPIPVVISPNFSVGANFLFSLTELLSHLPSSYDFSIVEAHHIRKADAPSGTASKLAEIVRVQRRYTKTVHGRDGLSQRKPEELEVLSVRGGGIPGQHDVLAAGAFETIRLEHTVFSRSAFATGALLAAKWVLNRRPGIYGHGSGAWIRMTRAVIKFGGATLADGERVRRAAQMIAEAPYEEKVVVVSAPGRTTDQLLNLVSSFEDNIEGNAYAEILSMGERTSAKVLTSALRARGIKVKEFDPTDDGFPVVTNGDFLNAAVDLGATKEKCRTGVMPILKDSVAVVPGFLGRCETRITVLGRGGSDITATVLGNCLEADEVILVKDTSGVMSADPNVVPDARPVSKITIDEMYALAHGGAKVVRPEALFYKVVNQRLRVVPFGRPLGDDGTEITGSILPTDPYFAKGSGLSELTVVSDLGVAVLGQVLDRMVAKVKGIGTGRTTITFFMQGDEWQEACRRVHGVNGVKAVSGRAGIGYIEVVHPHLVDQPGVVATAATILSMHGINIIEVTSSKGAMTFFVDEKRLDEAYGLLEENLLVGQLDTDKA